MADILNILSIVFITLLILLFSLKFIGIPGFVTRMPFTEVYKIVIIAFLFITSLIGAILDLTFGEWILLITLIFWGYIQYKNHWQWIANEPSEEDIAKYREKIGENITIFKSEEKNLRPDLYHCILHSIALTSFIIVAIRLVQFMTYLP